jgi:hypothetical protein
MLTLPIRGIKQVAESLANMDFTVEIKKIRGDEIGEMQQAMIKIRDSLKKGICINVRVYWIFFHLTTLSTLTRKVWFAYHSVK